MIIDAVASIGKGGGRRWRSGQRPGWHHPGGNTPMKVYDFLRLNLRRTVDKRWVGRWRRSRWWRWLKRKKKKTRVTPSVTAPGDANVSDVTESLTKYW